MNYVDMLASLELFRDLTLEQRAAILALMHRRDILSGESLVTEGERSDALYILLHGALEVIQSKNTLPIAQIRAGEVVGEIGFFAETTRTATVRATRDATVLQLNRAAYDQVVSVVPAVATRILAVISRRLAETSAQLTPSPRLTAGRTIAVVQGGREAIPPAFFERLRTALAPIGARLIDRKAVEDRFGPESLDRSDVAHWLNGLEWDDNPVVYVGDPELSAWTRKCVRQADSVLIVTCGEAPTGGLTPTEAYVTELHGPRARRLLRVHDRRTNTVNGTRAWLQRIEVFMHHHLALEDAADFHSLIRFLTGQAIGFVAGGGGALGAAHPGVYKAFVERGVTFDIFVGTSVGAAMTAGFAMLHDADYLDAGTKEIFVTGRAFKRPTWPRFALLDHKVFDKTLAQVYGPETLIEDCWRPYAAIASNLSTNSLEVIRSGLVWKAVRASAAIPAVLPPLYTEQGAMLVDGAVMDNAPLAPMKALKSGPNLLVHFGRTEPERFLCRYEELPGRWELIASLLNPFARRRLPHAPGAVDVLLRSMMGNQRYDLLVGPNDLVLRPPPGPITSQINFDQHTQMFRASYSWASQTLDHLAASEDPALAAILAVSRISR